MVNIEVQTSIEGFCFQFRRQNYCNFSKHIARGQRVQECASGILTKKRDGNPHGLPPRLI